MCSVALWWLRSAATHTRTHTENILTSRWTLAESTPASAVFSLGFDFLVRHLQKSKPKKTTERQSGGRRVQRDDTSCWNSRLKSTGNKTDHFLFAFLPCCLCIYRPAAVDEDKVALNVKATQLVEACRRNADTTGALCLVTAVSQVLLLDKDEIKRSLAVMTIYTLMFFINS